jgi:multidrug efflux pump subunit AcrA (membrane-fusion protein)
MRAKFMGMRTRVMRARRIARPLRILTFLATLLLPFSIQPAFAHEGHDHTAQTSPAGLESGLVETARFAAQSDAFEVVLVNRAQDAVIYVDSSATDEPVTGATVALESGGAVQQAREAEPGLYLVAHSLPPGKHDIQLRVTYDGYEEHFSGSLDVFQPQASARSSGAALPWIKGTAFAGVGFGLAMLAFWGGNRRAGGALLLAMMAVVLLATKAVGHDGPHPDSPQDMAAPVAAPGPSADLPDAPSPPLRISKATQRLIGVRTMRAHAQTLQDTREMSGRVIADPNGIGRVQSERDGRIEPPESGFLQLGQRVEKGALLGYLVPTLTTSDEANLQQTLAQIERDSALLVTKSDSVGIVNPNMPMTEAGASLLQELQIQAEGLRKQKEAVLAALQKKIPILAPLSGIISKMDLAAGQIVGARETLAEIVDPNRKLVEAFSFDNLAASRVTGAAAEIDPTRKIELAWVGTAPVLRQLATPILFRPQQGAAQFEIGTPARVFARLDRKLTGVLLPREALTRDARGRWVVWEHTEPETFVAHAVTPTQVDAEHVLVPGLEENARIVVAGAGLLGQAR